jgi:hypothetical protein
MARTQVSKDPSNEIAITFANDLSLGPCLGYRHYRPGIILPFLYNVQEARINIDDLYRVKARKGTN